MICDVEKGTDKWVDSTWVMGWEGNNTDKSQKNNEKSGKVYEKVTNREDKCSQEIGILKQTCNISNKSSINKEKIVNNITNRLDQTKGCQG